MNRNNLVPPVVLGFVGLCCFPLGLVAGIWGLIALLAAKKEGREVPVLALVCLALFGMSIVTNSAILMYAAKQNAEREAKKDLVTKKLAGKLEGETLEKDVACALAEEHLLKDKLYEWVKCDGEWQAGPLPRATVSAKFGADTEHSTFCFARAHRWYVLMVPGDGKCPDAAPAVPSAKAASLDEEEDTLRADALAARAKALVESFGEKIAGVRKAVEVEHEETACKLPQEVKAAYVDYDALPGAQKAMKPWPLLTHQEVRTALDGSLKVDARAKAIDSISSGGGVLVVFQSDELKVLPKATGSSFLMGEFGGWLSVVELSSGKLLCDAPFKFLNSETVGGGVRLKYAPKKSTQELADDDLEDKFEDAAKTAAEKMSGGKLKLRIGFIN